MFTVQLRKLFFKKNIEQEETLLDDQKTTYAILRYAHDIPTSIFNSALDYLAENIDEITDIRLVRFVNDYIKSTGVGFEFTDEFDHSLEIVIGEDKDAFSECMVFYEDSDED